MVDGLMEIADFDYILHTKKGEYYIILKNGSIFGAITNPYAEEFQNLEIREEK